MMIPTVNLVLVLALVYGILGSSCPASSPLSFYVEKLHNATEEIITDMQAIVLQSGAIQDGPANVTTLYTALTASLNATPSENGYSEFSDAFDVITDSYFKACYGPEEEKPNQSDAQSILTDFLSLLENRSDITRMRQLFGELSCLQNFSNASLSHVSKRSLMVADLSVCAMATSISLLYKCLDANNQLDCIFNLNDPSNCTTTDDQPLSTKEKKHCLAFVVDTTGSMGVEISHVRTVIQHFLQSEENNITLCYVLVPFNDYGYESVANFRQNLDFDRIYDANYHSNISYQYPSFSMTDTSITVRGVNDLLTDVNSLTADGGADCPEYGMTAILAAIDLIDGINKDSVQTQGKHNIIVLTDASAKDDSLYQSVIDAANDKDKPDVTIHFFYSGSGCDGSFGHYEDVKTATGGYSVNQIDAANFQIFADFITGSYDSDSGKRRRRNTPDSCQYFQISRFVRRFSCLIETSSSSITITKPDSSSHNIATFANSFAVYKDTNPQPGNWRACVSSGTLKLSFTLSVSLELDVNYLKESEYGVLLPTKQQLPYACDTHTFTISSPQMSNISLAHPLYLEMIDNLNNVLQYAQLSECGGFLSGSITLPSGSVQYQLRGQDIGGIPFTHVVPDSFVTFDTSSIQAQLKGKSTVVLNPGGTSIARVAISNIKSGPKSLQANVSIIIHPQVNVRVDSTSFTLEPMQQEKELQITFATSKTVTVGQTLAWSIVIRDTCSNELSVVNYTAAVKPSMHFNVTGISKSMLSFEWLPPVDPTLGNITHYVLTLDYTNGTIATVNVSGDINEYEVNELSPYQQVYASILAHSDNGETAEIAPIDVMTNQAEPGPVSQLVTESISETSVLISWSLPQQQNGIILFYEVSVMGLYTETHNSSAYNIKINGLNPYTRYTAMVSAATSAGKGWPITFKFYSLEGIPTKSPSLANYTILTPTSFIIEWDPPPIQHRRGFIQHYTIQAEHNQKINIYNSSTNSFNITGLPEFSDINVSISASTFAGQGPFSEVSVIHVVTGVASAPHNFTAIATSSRSAILKWEHPKSPNGKILYYQLYYKQYQAMYQILNITTKNRTYHVQNLEDSKDYYFIINAINYAGKGENSTEIRVSLRMHHAASNENALAIALPVTFTCLVILGLIALVVIIIVYHIRIRQTKSIIFSTQTDEENYKESEDEERKGKQNGLFEEEVELEEISKNHKESEDEIKNGKLEVFVEEKTELEETSESYEKNEDEEKREEQKSLFEEELELEKISENKEESEDDESNEKEKGSVEEKVEFEETLENHEKSEGEEKERKQKGFVEEKVEMYEEISMRNN